MTQHKSNVTVSLRSENWCRKTILNGFKEKSREVHPWPGILMRLIRVKPEAGRVKTEADRCSTKRVKTESFILQLWTRNIQSGTGLLGHFVFGTQFSWRIASPPPWGSKFFQFHAVLGNFGKIVSAPEGWHPYLRGILDPSLMCDINRLHQRFSIIGGELHNMPVAW